VVRAVTKTPGKKPGKRKVKKKPARKKTTDKVVKPPSARRRSKTKVYAESEVARVRVPDAEQSREAARFHAGKDYVYDPEQRTGRWWWESHYRSVPWDTFRRWSQMDDWSQRREDFWRYVESALGQKIASDVVREQAEEVQELLAVRRLVFAQLKPDKDGKLELPPIKSLEALIKTAIDIDKRADDKRSVVTDNLPLALGSTGAAESQLAGPGVSFSEEEIRAMAQARMRVQQKQLEEAVSAESSRVEPDEEG
jgi:hypothetical protein